MKIIRFVPSLPTKEKMLAEPVPAKKDIAEWYKEGETTYFYDGKEHPGLKTCKPFLDVMISGYYILTPFDINVERTEDGNVKFSWDGPEEWQDFIGERLGAIGSTIPRPAGHRSNHLVWASRWGWKTPKGWSSIITHPINRLDLPFTTTSGLIDSDNFFGPGNIPFFIKEDFVGTIKKGTPFAQIIPVKRSSWASFADYGLISPNELKGINLHNHKQSYKSVDWEKKEYN
jgi:hypothetical protein